MGIFSNLAFLNDGDTLYNNDMEDIDDMDDMEDMEDIHSIDYEIDIILAIEKDGFINLMEE